MTDAAFPVAVERVVSTLAAICRRQGNIELAEVLDSAIGRIEESGYDNWDGGTTYYTLYLEVPIERYAPIEPDLEEVERLIAAKVSKAVRFGNAVLNSVAITPILAGAMTLSAPSDLHPTEATHLWTPNLVRLFLSHVSSHKVQVTALKNELDDIGVSGFVAHQDIEPSLEWQEEIKLALRTMHSMAALLTRDFHDSYWTDQEVGTAVARGVLMIPVDLGLKPYGFMAKNQALPGDLDRPKVLASQLAKVLAKSPGTRNQMAEALVVAMESAGSFAAARSIMEVIEIAPAFNEEQLRRLEASIDSNSQVSGSYGVPDRIRRVVARHREGGMA